MSELLREIILTKPPYRPFAHDVTLTHNALPPPSCKTEFTMDTVTLAMEKPNFSQYFNELDANSKARYREKVELCGGVDPYSNTVRFEVDVAKWPKIDYPDIVNCLVLTTSFLTGKQMKAYKSLTSYNFFVSGWVQDVKVKVIEDKCILYASVSKFE